MLLKAMVLQDWRYLLAIILGIVPCIFILSLYGVATSHMAFRLGDPTPKLNGGFSFHPLIHVEPIGFLLFTTTGLGWNRCPAMIPNNFKHPWKDTLISHIVGLLSVFLSSMVFLFLTAIALHHLPVHPAPIHLYGTLFLLYCSVLSFSFVLFQWIPLPYFLGFRCILPFLSQSMNRTMEKYQNHLIILWIVSLWSGLWNLPFFTLFSLCFAPFCQLFQVPFSLVTPYFL